MNGFRNVLESPALAAVLAERLAQIDLRGHDPESDAGQPPHRLPDLAAQYARISAERAAPGPSQHLAGARKKAVQAAALAIAAVERLDVEIDRQANAMRDEGDQLARDAEAEANEASPDLPGLLG